MSVSLFDIQFENPTLTYCPGDTIRGQVVFNLDRPLKVSKIDIQLHGEATVRWTETDHSNRTNHTNRASNTTNTTYTGHRDIIKVACLLATQQAGTSPTLKAGHRTFPFALQLPTVGLSSSFQGAHGSIRYKITANIEKSWFFNPSVKKDVIVVVPIDSNDTRYSVPLQGAVENSGFLGMNFGPVTLTGQINRQAFCSGESIEITAQFKNNTNRTVTPKLVLTKRVTYTADTLFGNGKTRRIDEVLIQQQCQEMSKGESSGLTSYPLQVPHAVPSILDCPIIRIEYILRALLYVPLGSDATLDFPIVIATVPYKQVQPYPTQHNYGQPTNYPPQPTYQPQPTHPPPPAYTHNAYPTASGQSGYASSMDSKPPVDPKMVDYSVAGATAPCAPGPDGRDDGLPTYSETARYPTQCEKQPLP